MRIDCRQRPFGPCAPRRCLRRWHVAIATMAGVCVAALAAAELAGACSCAESPLGPQTRERLQQADAAFVGTVVQRMQQEPEPGQAIASDVPVQLRFRVERDVKGGLGSEVIVHTSSNGGTCGLSADVGDRLALFLRREGDHYTSGLCSVTTERRLVEAARKLPKARGDGLVRFIVAGGFGASGVIALDRRGRPLGYGRDIGRTVALDVCPGGRRSIETTVADGHRRLYVRSLRSMRLLRRIKLGGEPVAVSCRGRYARDYKVAFTTGDGDHDARGTLIDVHDGRSSVTYRGGATVAAIGTRYAWMAGARTPPTRIDLRSGATRRVGSATGPIVQMSASPDGRQVAVLSRGGPLRVLDASGVRASRPDAGDPLWTDRRTLVVQTTTRRAALLRTVNDRMQTIRTLGGISARSVLAADRGELFAIDGTRRLSSVDARRGRIRRLSRVPATESSVLATVGGETRVQSRARKPCANG